MDQLTASCVTNRLISYSVAPLTSTDNYNASVLIVLVICFTAFMTSVYPFHLTCNNDII